MTIKFAQSTSGFYDISIHGDNIPADAVEITAEEHAALLAGQSDGKRIIADANGRPVLADPPSLTADSALLMIKAARQSALDTFAKSAGISAVYAENLLAAQRYAASNVTPMRGGETPEQYLTAMAVKMGVSGATFSAYILSENALAARKAAAVEHAYLDFAYVRLPSATAQGVDILPAAFEAALLAALNTP